jgi:hypothetical protein
MGDILLWMRAFFHSIGILGRAYSYSDIFVFLMESDYVTKTVRFNEEGMKILERTGLVHRQG